MTTIRIIQGDVLKGLASLPDEAVHCVVTSPPYWGLRDYQVDGQIGLEKTPEEYVEKMVHVFREVKRVLRKDGTVWLNLGDCYAANFPGGNGRKSTADNVLREIDKINKPKREIPLGLKPKDLIGIPWRVAFALQANGWYLRSDIIWSKPNPMPESVTDRPTKAHEYIFLLAKSERYFYDADVIREAYQPASVSRSLYIHNGEINPSALATKNPSVKAQGYIELNPNGRNKRDVWEIPTQAFPDAHFATFPEVLVEPCIKAGCPTDGVVLDPFAGSGTVAKVARDLGRDSIMIELSPAYIEIMKRRLRFFEQLTPEISELKV